MDGRAYKRFSLDREIQCHINDVADWVFVYDLSSGGAMIEVANIKVEVGDLVRLNLFDFTTMAGRVAWKSERSAGIRFDSLLGDAIVGHLGFCSSTLGFDERLPKDRFGQLIPDLPPVTSDQGGIEQPDPDPQPQNWWEVASPQADRRKDDRGDAARRREDRQTIDAGAVLCSLMREGIEGRLTDFSASGCSFFDRSGRFEPGNEVWLKIGSLEPWKGTVRWVGEDHVGIEFERTLHPAIFDHLAKSNPPAVCAKAA